MTIIKILSEEWSYNNFQKCSNFHQKFTIDTTWEKLVRLKISDEEGEEDDIETFLLLKLSPSYTLSKNSSAIKCDMRIRHFQFSQIDLEKKYAFSKASVADILISKALFLFQKSIWNWNSFTHIHEPENEQNEPSIKTLKSGIIKELWLTVILKESENDFRVPDKIDYADLIRDCFSTYKLHVISNTIIDFRTCPMASSIFPNLEFVYVENAHLKKCDIGRVTPSTTIKINKIHYSSYYNRMYLNLKSLSLPGIELTKELELMSELIDSDFNCKSYKSFLIGGPQGSGKKQLVQNLATLKMTPILGINFAFEENSIRNQVKSVILKINNLFCTAVHNSVHMSYPSIILLENIDILSGGGNTSSSISNKNKLKITNHIAKLLDELYEKQKLFNSSIVVIATTSKPYLVPRKLQIPGRISREIFIKVPNLAERLSILKNIGADNAQFSSEDLDFLAEKTPGYVAADLVKLMHLALLRSHELKNAVISKSVLKYSLSRVLPSVLKDAVGLIEKHADSQVSIDDISGLDSVKLNLTKAIVWPLKSPHAFLRLGIQPSKGIILYGPSGCGKTTLVRGIAASHSTNFLSVSAAELFSSAVGESEKIIAHLFHQARLASPSILFIDEIDAVVGSRDSSSKSGKSVSEAILAMLLVEMDGIGTQASSAQNMGTPFGPRVVVVGATNRIDCIDSALVRPGRFDCVVPVPPPSYSSRLELLKKCTKNTPLEPDVDLGLIAQRTEYYSGADIVNLCREAALLALSQNMESQSVSMAHFLQALSASKPSISPQEYYKYYPPSSQNQEEIDTTNLFASMTIK